jgi:hypothetical protein|eukprot:SAG25_NODE_238_length_11236_cov_37.046061_13_plen_231_part_00
MLAAKFPLLDLTAGSRGVDCAQMCLAWMSDLVYSGSGGSGNECWCSDELNTAGPPPNKEADKLSDCNTKCSGVKTEMCGGYFLMSVHHVHQLEETMAWIFVAVFFVGIALYTVGGIAVGMKYGRGRSIRAHPHHHHWVNLAGLVMDGVSFTTSGGRGRGSRHSVASASLLGGNDRARPSKPSKGKSKKSKKSSADGEPFLHLGCLPHVSLTLPRRRDFAQGSQKSEEQEG